MDVHDLKFLFDSFEVKAQSKIFEHPEDANHRRFKDKWLLIITSALLLFTFLFITIFVLLNPASSNSGIAINALTGIVMGISGYYVRGKS